MSRARDLGTYAGKVLQVQQTILKAKKLLRLQHLWVLI